MKQALQNLAGLLLLAGLALSGNALAAALSLPVPGAVLGLGIYLLLLSTGVCDWSLPGATLLTGLIGAMLVPALVGLTVFGGVFVPAAAQLGLVLVVSTAVTALATALLFRLAGGRG